MIEDILSRLNRLGNAVRQASSGGLVSRAARYAGDLDVSSFEELSHAMIQLLYPQSEPSLRNHLQPVHDRSIFQGSLCAVSS